MYIHKSLSILLTFWLFIGAALTSFGQVTHIPVSLNQPVKFEVKAGSDETLCWGNSTMLNLVNPPTMANPYVATWVDLSNQKLISIQNPIVQPMLTTSYYVVGKHLLTGCVAIDTVMVNVQGNIPIFTVAIDTLNKKVSFSNATQGNNSYLWEFGDGQISNEASPIHSYSTYGMYTVCLTAYDSLTGCQTKTCKKGALYQKDQGCEVDFSYVIDTLTKTIAFTNLSTTNTIKSYWLFGDGQASNQFSPSHSYAQEGYYKVKLITKDTLLNCVDMEIKDIKVVATNQIYKADFSYYVNVATKEVVFADKSDFPPNSTYLWDFNTGIYSSTPNPTHQFFKEGFYSVCLTVIDSAHTFKNTVCKIIKVDNLVVGCKASFTYVLDTLSGKALFTNTSVGSQSQWEWKLGTGASTYTKEASSQFEPGYYLIQLNTFDSLTGCRSMAVDVINVKQPKRLKASFGYYIQPIVAKGVYPTDYSGAAYGEPSAFEWSFGDGSTNNSNINPTHEYEEEGAYEVCFTVFNDYTGDVDSACQLVVVEPTAIQEYDLSSQVFLYPNPVNDELSIHLVNNLEILTIGVYNELGQIIYQEIVSSNKPSHRIPVANFAKGIYMIKLESDKGVGVKRFVKQ